MEGLLDGGCQLPHVFDQEIVLDDGPGDAHGVTLLESIQPNGGRGHLPRDDDHGDGVHVSRGYPRHRIGHARPGSHQRHADVAGRSGVTVGRVYGGLLMAHQDVLNRVLFVQGIVDVEHRSAGITPEEFDAFSLKAADQDFGPVGVREGRLRRHSSGRTDFGGRNIHDKKPL